MECLQESNKSFCNCTYPCSNHGVCCKCIQYHRKRNELPACYFDVKNERTYDRSIANFIRINSR